MANTKSNIKDYKITIFGDSVPKGVILVDGKVTRLSVTAIQIIEEHYGVKIENNSVFGQTLKRIWEKGYIDRYISTIDENEKNMLIFSIGGNDSDFYWETVARDPYYKHDSKTNLNEFISLLEEVTTKLQKHHVRVVFTNLFPIDSKRYFENVICKLCDGNQILKFFNDDISNINRHQECFSIAINNNAKKHNCLLIDIRTDFLMDTAFLNCLADDGVHPNEQGQRMIATKIIEQLG